MAPYLVAWQRFGRCCEHDVLALTSHPALVVLGRNNPSLYTVNGRPLYVHLNGLAIVLLK